MTDPDLDQPISINCSVQDLAFGMVCSDLISSFNEACDRADIDTDWDQMKHLTLEKAMHSLAPNGFRFVYAPQFELESSLEVGADIAAALEFMKGESSD